MVFRFNKIYIIESLADDEIKTGKYLYEDLFHHNDKNNEYGFEYQTIKNAYGLKIYLELILFEIKSKSLLPIIHFEMHGGNEGIQLSSGEIIQWNDVAVILQKINIELKNKLVVVFALCYGINFLSVFGDFVNSRAPFAGLLSTADYLLVDEIQKGFIKFYKGILETRNGNEAIKTLNEIITEENRHYSFLSCRWLFKQSFIEYLKLCTVKQRNQRVENIITKIKTTNPKVEINKIRKEIKHYLHKHNQKEYFQKTRDKFLMYDLDESNQTLFYIDFQEVMDAI